MIYVKWIQSSLDEVLWSTHIKSWTEECYSYIVLKKLHKSLLPSLAFTEMKYSILHTVHPSTSKEDANKEDAHKSLLHALVNLVNQVCRSYRSCGDPINLWDQPNFIAWWPFRQHQHPFKQLATKGNMPLIISAKFHITENMSLTGVICHLSYWPNFKESCYFISDLWCQIFK